MQERPKYICYLVSLLNRKLRYVTELCPTIRKRAGDVKVHMRDRLFCRNPIVLPNSYTSRLECTRDRGSSRNDGCHDCGCFSRLKIEQSWTMRDRNNRQRLASLSARRDSERASRRSAVIAFAEEDQDCPRRRRSCC